MGEVCWCVVCRQAVVFCTPWRVVGWFCLGVPPTWCIIAGAETGSICNRTSFNSLVFYFRLWVVLWVEPCFYSLLTKIFPVVWLLKLVRLQMEPVSAPAIIHQVGKTPRQNQPTTRPGAQKTTACRQTTHQQTSPILPQTRSRYIPPTSLYIN